MKKTNELNMNQIKILKCDSTGPIGWLADDSWNYNIIIRRYPWVNQKSPTDKILVNWWPEKNWQLRMDECRKKSVKLQIFEVGRQKGHEEEAASSHPDVEYSIIV